MPIDYTKYPPNWLTEIRPRIMNRARMACEQCGAMHKSIIKREKNNFREICEQERDMITAKIKYAGHSFASALKNLGFTRVILTIAHLDNDPENLEVTDERLKALCQKCHLGIDAKHHAENRKYGRDHRKHNYKLEL